MRNKGKIILGIVVAILLVIAWFIYQQWNSISAMLDAVLYSQENIETRLNEDKESVQQFLEKEEGITVRELTQEESDALKAGTMTEEEVVELIISKQEPEQTTPPSPTQKPQTPSPTQTPPKESAEPDSGEAVARQIAKLYIQKNHYLGKLDTIEAQVRQAYIDLPTEEKKGAKQRFLAEYLPMVSSWEKECDDVVYGILDEIRTGLKKAGKGDDIADKLESAYLNEKKAKKSYFINRYMD